MCAIAGILDLPFHPQIIQTMLHTMARRGPDGHGTLLQEQCALLHTRLAVIDPAGGKQPMRLTWQGETYTLTYNGELYNTSQLRSRLACLGHSFSGHSDTEVLLHAFAQWGEECLDELNGIFAFGVWCSNSRRLFLARDRMGVKPLFYKLHEGGLLFASELKTILSYPTVHAQLDAHGAAELLLLGPGRSPGCGIFHGIDELEPGCCAWYSGQQLRTHRYWQLKDREHTQSFEETAQYIRYLVTDAIERQTVSDVPLGTFLSGGLDSSLISALCAQNADDLQTFSVDYADNDRYFIADKFQPNSDNDYIRLMTDALHTRHSRCVLTPQMLLDGLQDSVLARDLPGMADVDISLLLFCRQIRENVTVALSGECADELFGGYPWYRDSQVRNMAGFPWSQNLLQRKSFLHPALQTQIHAADYVLSRYERTCRESDILPGTDPLERRMKEMTNLNVRWFMQTLLERKDRMSMYCALEVRVPFCDHRLAEYLYSVPWHYKDHRGREKGLLRTAMEGLLPPQVLWRKKSPYPKTLDPKYLSLMRAQTENLLDQPNARLFDLVDRQAVRGLLHSEYAWPWYGQLMRLPQTLCYLLQMNYWLEAYRVELCF